MILSFWTNRFGQTVQTQIILLQGAVSSGSTLFAVSSASFGHITTCSNFRVITATFLGVGICKIFTVVNGMHQRLIVIPGSHSLSHPCIKQPSPSTADAALSKQHHSHENLKIIIFDPIT